MLHYSKWGNISYIESISNFLSYTTMPIQFYNTNILLSSKQTMPTYVHSVHMTVLLFQLWDVFLYIIKFLIYFMVNLFVLVLYFMRSHVMGL